MEAESYSLQLPATFGIKKYYKDDLRIQDSGL